MSIETSHKKAKDQALMRKFGEKFQSLIIKLIEKEDKPNEIISTFFATTKDQKIKAKCVLLTGKRKKGDGYTHYMTCDSNILDKDSSLDTISFAD